MEAVKVKFYCFLGIVHPTVYNTVGNLTTLVATPRTRRRVCCVRTRRAFRPCGVGCIASWCGLYWSASLLLHGQQHSASSSVMSQGGAGRQGAAQYRSGLPGEGRRYPLVPGTGLNLFLLGASSPGLGHPLPNPSTIHKVTHRQPASTATLADLRPEPKQ